MDFTYSEPYDQLDRDGKIIDQQIDVTHYTPRTIIYSKTELERKIAGLQAEIAKFDLILKEFDDVA